MKHKTDNYPPFTIEINRHKFRITPKLIGEAQHGEFGGMPLPHYVYRVKVERLDKPGTEPLAIDYHAGFEEWARAKPYMPSTRALQIFADFVVDAGLSIARKPEELIEAWELDTDMANQTWRMFQHRREALKDHFRMTTTDILSIANAFHALMVNGRLAELIEVDKGVGRNE